MTASIPPAIISADALTHVDVVLACPRCGAVVARLVNGARPIQEQRIACPQCKRASRYAKLRTDSGDTLQVYMRALFAGRQAGSHRRARPRGRGKQPGSRLTGQTL